VAQANYAGAVGRQSTRVVSCNTTALVRVLGAFHQRNLIKRARTVILRRATDTWESHKNGIINTVIPEAKVPSHQGPDVKGDYNQCEQQGGVMLYWAVVFFVISIIAALFGFTGIAVATAGIAKILFFIFLILFLLALIFGIRSRPRV